MTALVLDHAAFQAEAASIISRCFAVSTTSGAQDAVTKQEPRTHLSRIMSAARG